MRRPHSDCPPVPFALGPPALLVLAQVLRHLSQQRPQAPQWRAQRPYIVAHKVEVVPEQGSAGEGEHGLCTLAVCGYLRGRGINVNQLVSQTFLLSTCPALFPHTFTEQQPQDWDRIYGMCAALVQSVGELQTANMRCSVALEYTAVGKYTDSLHCASSCLLCPRCT